jgi:hypothetical protein
MILLEHTERPSRWGNWWRNAVLAAVGLAVLVLAFFFLAVAVVTGALLAATIALRWWWITRRLRQRAERNAVLDGEYRIIERRTDRPPT